MTSMTPTKADIKWMKRCLLLAQKGMGLCSPNPMVGSVIVDGTGKKISEGFHKGKGTLHGEQDALAKAKRSVKGATLYVNLEPCKHKTGGRHPCTQAIIEAGIKRVVYGVADPIKAHGGGAAVLKKKGLEVFGPLLEEEAVHLNRGFLKHSIKGTPYIIGKVAMSLNGCVSTSKGESKWITSESARKNGRQYRVFCDGILVGINTVINDNPRLTARDQKEGHDPIRIVLDSRLRTPLESKLLPSNCQSNARVIVACLHNASMKKKTRLESAGAEVWSFGGGSHKTIPIAPLLKKLGRSNVLSLLVEGGPTVLGQFISERQLDELVIYTAPKLIVGGKNWLSGEKLKSLGSAPTWVRYGGIESLAGDTKMVFRLQ